MRAFHMPSLPEMPLEHLHNDLSISSSKLMKLKILYSLDDNNFLARSTNSINVKTTKIQIPNQSNLITIGIVNIKDALEPILISSPELFNDLNWDYSVYVKDISEEDEPFVGHGLISNLPNVNEELLVTGRVCSNFVTLLNKSNTETLEIKLRLARTKKVQQQQIPPPHQQQQQQQQPQLQQQKKKNYRRSSLSQQQKESSDTENEFDIEKPIFVEPKLQALPKMTRFVNNNPAPKAARTQSLPVFENMMKPPTNGKPVETFPIDSIPLRIYMADKGKNNSKINDINVAKRFSTDFIKSNSKKKQKKSSTKKDDHNLYQSCFNCKTLDAKGWKWNESEDLSKRGLLCSLCFNYLREKGTMRPKKLFIKQQQQQQQLQKSKKLLSSSSPNSNVENDTTPATTPIKFSTSIIQNKELPSSSSYLSSDSLNGFDDMINEIEFHCGPLTDIDPFPVIEKETDKENIPPQKQSIAAQLQEYHEQRQKQQQQLQPSPEKATKQTSFEKMLTKSFSGVLPNSNNGLSSPSEWMNTFFEEQQQEEPTPKDQTPKDYSPKDITTCNTLPCNEDDEIDDIDTPKIKANDSKKLTMPSSPFLNLENINEDKK